MPHEKINYPRSPETNQLVVAYDPIGWVSVSVYPEGWADTGDAEHVRMNPQELDLLIKSLQKARRKAYGKGERWYGHEDGVEVQARPLFNRREVDTVTV